MSFYKCLVLFFRVQCDIVVLEKTSAPHAWLHYDSYYVESERKKIDSAITEQAIAIAIVLNHVE